MQDKFIPYGRQTISDDDIAAVTEVLQSSWLTTGPMVERFESCFCDFSEADYAVAVSNGTASLHCAMAAADIQLGDEVIVPAMTFVATANSVVYQGATPVFADIEADTLLINASKISDLITPKTKAIAAVDYAGQPADYDAIKAIADSHGLTVVADASHAPGGTYKDRPVGTLADLTTFSFHPVKHLTTGEGGMITTNDAKKAETMRRFRNHGINSDHRSRATSRTFVYDMIELGFNYRLNDIQCALGITQLNQLGDWVSKRQKIATLYDQAFQDMAHVSPLVTRPDRTNAYHLYVIRLSGSKGYRERAYEQLQEKRIGVNVHYLPVHLHSFYADQFGYGQGLCPVAESVYEEILTLPMYPLMSDEDVQRVIEEVGLLEDLA